MESEARVGIIANPASGKDVRRLVAYGSVFDNLEKANILRRILLGLDAAGVNEVLIMPDTFGVGDKALGGIGRRGLRARVRFLEMRIGEGSSDSTTAASIMRSNGCGAIVVLGGDGTCRAVSRGCGDVPLVPVSTGTNNVFPAMVEGTTAGIAAGAVARGLSTAYRRAKRLLLYVDGTLGDFALVDIALTDDQFVGARALWDMGHVRDVICAIGEPAAIGLSAIAGCFKPFGRYESRAVHLRLAGPGAPCCATVRAPVGPGLIEEVRIAGWTEIGPAGRVSAGRGPCAAAFDGERERLIKGGGRLEVELSLEGPLVVDIAGALLEAQQSGLFSV
ncbi:MAG: ATP-NAD kinase [Firmicutes bacterium]|nr:ATP-NAD kinase [Bacillota bacterium]